MKKELVSTTLVKSHFVQYLVCSVKLHFFVEFHSAPFRSVPSFGIDSSVILGMHRMSTFIRGITETVPSLFRGIFSERNSVPNPSHMII